jgi:predicted Zn-dependent peptidase
MIQYNHFTLDNGLQVVVHEDSTTPMAAVNMLYNVGARDENPDATGLAHLFEHLMFEGSENVPHFDDVLQMAGGVNNAFTSNDITNYYNILPANNLETAFWLESDRMANLTLDAEKVDVQKKVVIEEFKESHLNQPYGDVIHILSGLAFKVHPYQWPTIGKDMSHIEQVDETMARKFFNTFYRPNNCILSVGGNVTTEEVKKLANHWFGDIPSGNVPEKDFPKELPQEEPRVLDHKAEVPLHAIFKTYHMGDRLSNGFYRPTSSVTSYQTGPLHVFINIWLKIALCLLILMLKSPAQ